MENDIIVWICQCDKKGLGVEAPTPKINGSMGESWLLRWGELIDFLDGASWLWSEESWPKRGLSWKWGELIVGWIGSWASLVLTRAIWSLIGYYGHHSSHGTNFRPFSPDLLRDSNWVFMFASSIALLGLCVEHNVGRFGHNTKCCSSNIQYFIWYVQA